MSFPSTKSAEERSVSLCRTLHAALRELPHRTGALFRRPDGARYSQLGSGGAAIKTAFKTACERAGICHFVVRDLRSTWAVWHFAQHRDLDALMYAGGWRSIRMMDRIKRLEVRDLDAVRIALREQLRYSRLVEPQGGGCV